MKIIYSFNKKGAEAEYWTREIAAASDSHFNFLPFNHGVFLDPSKYIRAQLLDNLYFAKDPALMRMYGAFESLIRDSGAAAAVVDTCPPYHPDYLKTIPLYKVLRIADGPLSAYERDIPYFHAYDHVMYHSPAFSPEMGIEEKLRYCGVRRYDFWPHCAFEALRHPAQTESTLFSKPRDIDIVFVGALYLNKMPLLAKVKKAFGRRMKLHGLVSIKKNLYFNVKYGWPGWMRPIAVHQYAPLYQRSKIGINVHNRGAYTVGSYRMFDLPANGVMQISDGGEYLEHFFRVGQEVVGYRDVDDLIAKIQYYLEHDSERESIALNGFRRVMQDYTHRAAMHRLGILIEKAVADRTVG